MISVFTFIGTVTAFMGVIVIIALAFFGAVTLFEEL